MYKEIVEILKCPCCGTDLELITEKEENGETIEGLNCFPSSRQSKKYKIFPASRYGLLAVFMQLT